jgi:hypothetical protein
VGDPRKVDAGGSRLNNAPIRVVVLIALLVGVTVPVSQLRSSDVVRDRCCCPDPEFCHCPIHDIDAPSSTIQSCGKTSHLVIAPTLSVFVPPPAPAIAAIASAPAPELPLPAPHAPPDPARPPGPS